MFGVVSAGASLVSSRASSAGRYLFGKVRNVSEVLLGETGSDKENINSGLLEDVEVDKAYGTDIDDLADDRFEEAQSELEETLLKEVYQFDDTKVANGITAFDFPPIAAPNFESLFADYEQTNLLGQAEVKNVFSVSRSDPAKHHGDNSSTRHNGKSPKKKQTVKKEPRRNRHKRKRPEDEASLSSDNDSQEHAQLLNIQKDGRRTGSTSDYMSQVSEDPEPLRSPFQRSTEARISNLYRWNSVSGLVDPVKESRKPCPQRSPTSPPAQLTVGHINNAIISGTGDVKESTIVSMNSNDRDVTSTRVKDQTKRTLENFKRSGLMVETEGLLAARKLASDVTKRNKPIIVFGSGDGVTTVVNQLLFELSSSTNKRGPVENKTMSDNESVDSDSDRSATCPYVVNDPADWIAVDQDVPAVIAIHDPSGTIQTDLKLLNDMLRRSEQCLSTRRDATVLIALKKLPDFDESMVKETCGENLIDLQSKEHIISKESIVKLFENFMEKHHVRYATESKKKHDTGNFRLISHDTVREIMRQADRRGFVKNLVTFFENDISAGITAFTKPNSSIVKQIRKMYETRDPGLYALLAVHDYGGELSIERVEQIRRAMMTNKASWSAVVLDKFSTNDARGYNYRPPIPQNSLALKFAKMNKCMDRLGDILQDGMEQQDQNLLEEVKRIYRFRSGKVRTSLLLVLADLFPEETLLSCDDSFVSQYVCPRSVGKGKQNELYLPVESNRNCHVKKAILKRITDDVLQRKISMYTEHPLFGESWFVEDLFSYWTQKKDLLWKVLQQQQSTLEPYCLLYFGLDREFASPSIDGSNNVAEKVLKQGKWKEKRRAKSKWSEWVHSQEQETMMRAIELGRDTTVRLLADMGMNITEEMLQLAIKLGQTNIIKIFKKVGTFTDTIWWNALLFAFNVFSQDESLASAKDVFEQLTKKANVNSTEGAMQPLIHYAVASNDQKMTELLCTLSQGRKGFPSQRVNINGISSDGDTALNIATRNGNEAIVNTLLKAGAKQINQGNVEQLAVHIAAEMGNVNLLKILISDTPLVMNYKDLDGKTPLHVATENGHVLAVEELLGTEGIQINIQDSHKQTALHCAVQQGHLQLVEILVAKNTDMSLQNAQKETALSLAGKHANFTCAEVLLKGQVDKALQKDSIALMRAVTESDFGMLNLLIRYGYSLNTVIEGFGTPLSVAILNNRHDLARFLLDKGADVHQVIGRRQPILWAALQGDKEMFELLRRFGADIKVVEERTRDSVIHNVVKADNEDLTFGILSLPESSGLVDMKNVYGDTAVHIACRHGHSMKILEHLLNANFSKFLRNKQADNPMMIVESRRYTALKASNTAEWKHCLKLAQTLQTPKK